MKTEIINLVELYQNLSRLYSSSGTSLTGLRYSGGMKTYTLITGASSGIGKELARVAALKGQSLVLTARNSTELQSLQKELRHNAATVHIVAADLSEPDGAKAVYDFCKKKGIKISVLINNAGFGDLGAFAKSDLAKQRGMIAVNITSLTELTHLFLDNIKATKGKILNVASTAAFLPGPKMSVYYATKHYVLAFSEALAEELTRDGITVTALCPGPTRTGFSKAANATKSRLFTGNIPSAVQVARYGWSAMEGGKRVAVYGARNKLLVQVIRIMPRSLTARLVYRAQS